ncbi:hypothetical protein [Pseudomonas fluorescens]|nr:hypothetical protein [Pseudomonas fluorescens]
MGQGTIKFFLSHRYHPQTEELEKQYQPLKQRQIFSYLPC